MQLFEYRSSFANGPKRSAGRTQGAEKINFFNSKIMTTPPWRARRWNPRQFMVPRSLGGRLGSAQDVRKRLHRTRGGFHRQYI